MKLMHTVIFSATSTCEPLILSKETLIFSQSASKCLSLQSRPNVCSKTFSLPEQGVTLSAADPSHRFLQGESLGDSLLLRHEPQCCKTSDSIGPTAELLSVPSISPYSSVKPPPPHRIPPWQPSELLILQQLPPPPPNQWAEYLSSNKKV